MLPGQLLHDEEPGDEILPAAHNLQTAREAVTVWPAGHLAVHGAVRACSPCVLLAHAW